MSSYPIFRSKLVDSDEILLTTKCRLFFVCELWKNEWRGSCHCKNIRRVFAGTKFADLRKCLCYVVVGQSWHWVDCSGLIAVSNGHVYIIFPSPLPRQQQKLERLRFLSPSSIPQKMLNESVQEKPPISSKYLIQLNCQIWRLLTWPKDNRRDFSWITKPILPSNWLSVERTKQKQSNLKEGSCTNTETVMMKCCTHNWASSINHFSNCFNGICIVLPFFQGTLCFLEKLIAL